MSESAQKLAGLIMAYFALWVICFGLNYAFYKIEIYIAKRQFKKAYGYDYDQFAKKNNGMSADEACRILKIKKKDLKKMTKSDLKRVFRQRVKDTHPDHGGSSEEFINVKAAYEFAAA